MIRLALLALLLTSTYPASAQTTLRFGQVPRRAGQGGIGGGSQCSQAGRNEAPARRRETGEAPEAS